MGAVAVWAGLLLRRHWRATVLLGLLCGVAAGAVGAAWATARTTARTFPQFVERSGATGFFVSCPAGEPVTYECAQRYPDATVRDTVRGVPGVQSAARTAAVVGKLVPGEASALGLVLLYAEPLGRLANGSGRLLAGERQAPLHPGDIVVNESAARASGFEVGQRLTFTPYLASQEEAASGQVEPLGPALQGQIVGIVRQPIDLAADKASSRSASFAAVEMVVPPEWWTAQPDVYRYGLGVTAAFAPGADAERTKAAVVQRLLPRQAQFETESTLDATTVFDAINYQVWAARAFALVIAAVGLLLLGQAISRQVARESRDADLLRVLGLTRTQLALASGLRWTVTGVVAALTAFATMYAASPLAPIGIARKTIEHTHVDLDLIVGVPIAIATVLAVSFGGAWSAWRMRSRKARRVPASAIAIHARPATTTGIASSLQSLRRPFRTNSATALGAIVLVATAAIASAAVVHSYDRLLERPPQFGAPWDAVVGNHSTTDEVQHTAARLSRIDGIEGAAGIVDLDGQRVGDESVPIIAFVPVGDLPDVIGPQITEGRAPTGPNEIALGAITMRHLDLRVGDEVRIEVPNTKVGELRVRVVGRTLLNNTYGLEPGTGGVIDGEWAADVIRGEGSEPAPQQVAVRIAANADRAAVLTALEKAFPASFDEATPSTGLRNLGRIRTLPWTLVAMLGLLGGGVALQALLTSIRRRRRELAVLRAIGFTAANARASLRWQVATLSVIAAALSIPLGLLIGRLLWQLISRANGLAMKPDIPIATVALIAGLALVLPVVLIAVPARLEVRRNTSTTLRPE